MVADYKIGKAIKKWKGIKVIFFVFLEKLEIKKENFATFECLN